jgi:GNAT superfamily N-acetyltransferase
MAAEMKDPPFNVKYATQQDVPLLLSMIKELAHYERLEHEVVAEADRLGDSLFGSQKTAEALIGRSGTEPVGFALFFHNFSTFLGRPGLYLEDLFIKPAFRGRGFGGRLLARVAKIGLERNCGRLEWSVLNWNEPAIRFYKNLGAVPMDEWTLYRITGASLERLARSGDS